MIASPKLRLVSALFFTAVLCVQHSAAESKSLRIVSATSERLILEFSPRLIGFDTIFTTDGSLSLRPKIADCRFSEAMPGSPYSAVFTALAAVPSPNGFRLDNIEAQNVRRFPALMSPVPQLTRNGDFGESRYAVLPSSYSSTAVRPWAEVRYGGIARSVAAADIIITAARYDAASNSIEIPHKIRVTISFRNDSYIHTAISVSDIPAAIINPKQAAQWGRESRPPFAKRSDAHIASNGSYAKITIENEGIYRLTAADLESAGIGTGVNDATSIKLFGTGGLPLSETVSDNYTAGMVEQPIIVNTNNDGKIREIIFYASGASGFERNGSSFRRFLNYYSKNNTYLLTAGGAPGMRAIPATVPTEQPIIRPTTYIARIFNEEEIFNAFDSHGFGSGTAWFGRRIDGATTFTTVLPNLVREGSVYYRYSIAHRNDSDGYCTVSENGVTLGKMYLPGCNTNNYIDAYSAYRADSMPATSISADGRSILKFAYSNSNITSSEAYFDWFEIHYPRECVANNGEIELFGNETLNGTAEYSINGFGQQIYGFDVTDRRNPQLQSNTSNTGGLFVLKSAFVQGSPRRFYISSNLKTPKIEKTEIANLTTNFFNTDIIIITHKDLLESATKFKQYRESTGLSACVVTVEQIYNEFAAGMPDIAAIRNYIGFALQNWDKKPRFVVLWGDGHYDFKGIQALQTNYIPTHQQITITKDNSTQPYDGTQTIAGDDFFARAVGDDKKVDIAIGRLPITSPEVGLSFVDKIKLYESNPEPGEWQQTVTLIADDGKTGKEYVNDGTEHSRNSEVISSEAIPKYIIQRKIYMAEYAVENLPSGRRKPDVTRDYLNMANNRGNLIMNYIGHGSPRVWAHELIFERETTVPQFLNLKKLFFLTAPTCDFGRFDDPNRNSGAEDLLFSKIGGSIGVFAATRPVYSSPNLNITLALFKQLFARKDGKYNRLGEAIYEVKQTLFEDNDQKFVLLADPTMRLLLPDYVVSIDSINGKPNTTDTMSLPLIKALSRVTIQASIRNAESNEVDETFNGRALITMTDCDVNDQVTDPADGVVHSISRPSGILNRSSYSVLQGKFTAALVVPKDISFSNKQGRIFAFAVDSMRTAKGDTRNFRIGGIESDGFGDVSGPDIDVYLDARTFHAGELVRKSPLLIVDLSDETGVNTTGMGIGHKIEAWFDDNFSSIDLTDAFQTSLEDSRKGSAEKQIFNLAPGNHTVRLRAWDVLNNYSETQTYFRTASDDKSVNLGEATAYPNPANASTNLTFTHNSSQPLEVEFNIFAADGRLVRRLHSIVTELHTGSVEWDCRNDNGEAAAQGSYTFTAVVTDAKGVRSAVAGTVQVSK